MNVAPFSPAMITVDLTDGALLKPGQVVPWNAEPANLDGLTFLLEAGSRTDGYRLSAKDDGLWLESCGTMIFFR